MARTTCDKADKCGLLFQRHKKHPYYVTDTEAENLEPQVIAKVTQLVVAKPRECSTALLSLPVQSLTAASLTHAGAHVPASTRRDPGPNSSQGTHNRESVRRRRMLKIHAERTHAQGHAEGVGVHASHLPLLRHVNCELQDPLSLACFAPE